ncbi:MAG: hypothetical protein MZV70_52095 [Desulfobacterales bacterium]|nr:hypothetical protein [Desulfobacterales bacterium]
MTDMEWAKAFSGAMAQTVAVFKTTGAQMAEADQEHRRGGRLLQHSSPGATGHSRATADHDARFGSRNTLQGFHHEGGRGR